MTDRQKPTCVLHCLHWVGSGGVEQCRFLLAKYLPADLYQHAIICEGADGELPGRFYEAGCDIYEIGRPHSILDPSWYRRALEISRKF